MFVADISAVSPLQGSGMFVEDGASERRILIQNISRQIRLVHGISYHMANTYSQIYIQAIFAVRGRASLIQNEWKEELFKYIGGIFRNKNQKLIAIGGVLDHIHLLFGLRPSMAISDLIRDVKADSTAFINEKRFAPRKFHWQEGFGAFSYSRSHLDAVAKYVLNQEKHHAKQSFKKEYLTLLDRFEVEYEDRGYLFDWID